MIHSLYKHALIGITSSMMLMACSETVETTGLSNSTSDTKVIDSKGPSADIQVIDLENFPSLDLSSIVDLTHGDIIGGDIFVKHSLDTEHKVTVKTVAQTISNTRVIPEPKINIAIDGDLLQAGDDYWGDAIKAAIKDWNSIYASRVHLTLTTSANADLIIYDDENQLPDHAIAAADYPSTQNEVGKWIAVNLDFSDNRSMTESQKRYNIAHEIAHTLGFRHTNWEALGEPAEPRGATLIPRTSNNDVASVMNGGTALFSWNGFSNGDLLAARTTYPWIILAKENYTNSLYYWQSYGMNGVRAEVLKKQNSGFVYATREYDLRSNRCTLKGSSATEVTGDCKYFTVYLD